LNKVLVNGSAVAGTVTTLTDNEELPNLQPFTYYVLAEFTTGVVSSPSNFARITARNDAPVAVADSYSVGKDGILTPPAPGVLGTATAANRDTDADSPRASLRSILVNPAAALPVVLPFKTLHGTITAFGTNGSFTYKPDAKYVGPDSFSYKDNNGFWSSVPGATCTVEGPTCIIMSPDSTKTTVSITVTKS
jgi:hypothetical protein